MGILKATLKKRCPHCSPSGTYLKVSTKELSFDLNIDLLRIEKILKVLKSFEPLGIFSNDLEEFLTLQLKSQNLLDNNLKYFKSSC